MGLVFLSACNSIGDDCREEYNVYVNTAMYHVVYDDQDDEFNTEKLSMPIYLNGIGNAYYIYDSAKVSNFVLILKDDAEMAQFEIADTAAMKDTITVSYKNVEEFISMECGCVINKEIKSVKITTNMLDSVIVEDVNVGYADENNLKLYFKTRQ